MLYGNSTILRKWLMSMPPPMEGTTYFNFIASHDGIGMRPAEGLISEKNIKAILKRMKEFGGEVSYRKVENKSKPYEINIALIDALKGTIDNLDNFQIQRFICAHAIMLSLEGIPAIYVHSFFGTENDYTGMRSTKQKRRASKETMKSLDLLTKATIAEQKAEIDLERIRTDAMKKVAELQDIDDRTRSLKLIDFMSEAIKEEMKENTGGETPVE